MYIEEVLIKGGLVLLENQNVMSDSGNVVLNRRN